MISRKESVLQSQIKELFVWGNHSSTQYPDTHYTTIDGKPLNEESREYYNGEFLTQVQTRGKAIID